VGSITAIYRYPVKSMMGESLVETTLSLGGIPGDRAWAVRDEQRGGIRGAKHFAPLMQCRARYLDETLAMRTATAEIALPTGETFTTDDPGAAARLSAFLDAPVSLWPLLPADALDHYRRGAPQSADVLTELRRVFARTADEPLPDLSAFPEFLRTYESPPGTYFDAYPLLLMTEASLTTLAARAPASRIDVRRFRPNLLIEGVPGEYPERAWCGRRLRVGTVLLEVKMACPRCVMTTLPFADLPADPAIMRTLVRETGGNLGVYAVPLESGVVRRGDRVELLA
jgi:uncharacterized protein YcbX